MEDRDLFVDCSSISCLWFEFQGTRTYYFFWLSFKHCWWTGENGDITWYSVTEPLWPTGNVNLSGISWSMNLWDLLYNTSIRHEYTAELQKAYDTPASPAWGAGCHNSWCGRVNLEHRWVGQSVELADVQGGAGRAGKYGLLNHNLMVV